MHTTSLEPYENDLRIEIPEHGDGTTAAFLSDIVENLLKETEAVMCKDNAKEVYQVACNLEYWASEIRRIYDMWKNNDFQKPNVL